MVRTPGTRVGEGLPDSLEPMVWALAPHPHDRDAVFAGLGDVARNNRWKWGGGDVYLSRDRGDSWQRLPIELPPSVASSPQLRTSALLSTRPKVVCMFGSVKHTHEPRPAV